MGQKGCKVIWQNIIYRTIQVSSIENALMVLLREQCMQKFCRPYAEHKMSLMPAMR